MNIKIIYLLFILLTIKNVHAADIEKRSNIAYGLAKEQVMDIYFTKGMKEAPVIFMVHGGAWRIGDKAARSVVSNKVNYWVPKGYIFISINYRMLPKAKPVAQAADVAKALAFAQEKVRDFGGSHSKFILMGHSAGAHLVSLVSTNSSLTEPYQISPWLGTVSIDSAAYDVVKKMSVAKPPRFYKKAFGSNELYWQAASPYYSLNKSIQPFLVVCSSKRKDDSCQQASNFVNKAIELDTKITLLKVDLSHRKLNTQLGKSNNYTLKVDRFIKGLLFGAKQNHKHLSRKQKL